MRLERLDGDKVKIFLTYDDLKERGISKEDIWGDLPKAQQLFRDMIFEADEKCGFQADGPIEVEVFSLPAQGMVVIVSKSMDADLFFDADDDDYIEMQVTLDESNEILYVFDDFEDVINLARSLANLGVTGGALFSYENRYYLHFFEEETVLEEERLVAIMAEYGQPSTLTGARLEEYGKMIIEGKAVNMIVHYF